MKTTLSIPDRLFSAADVLARRLGVSRSRLYADRDQVANLQAEHALVGRVVARDDDQIVALLLQAAGHRRPLVHLCRRHLDDLLALADVDRVVGNEDRQVGGELLAAVEAGLRLALEL